MRSRARFSWSGWCAIACVVSLSACGGKTTTTDDAGTSPGDAAPSPPAPPTPVADDGGSSCTTAGNNLDGVQTILRKCCPTCDAQQCNVVVQGACCPFSVSMTANLSAVHAFEQASKSFALTCNPCGGSRCPAVPSNSCNPTTSLCD